MLVAGQRLNWSMQCTQHRRAIAQGHRLMVTPGLAGDDREQMQRIGMFATHGADRRVARACHVSCVDRTQARKVGMTEGRAVGGERHLLERMAAAIVVLEAVDIGHAVVRARGDPGIVAEKAQ